MENVLRVSHLLLRQDKYEDKNKYEKLVNYLLTLHKANMR